MCEHGLLGGRSGLVWRQNVGPAQAGHRAWPADVRYRRRGGCRDGVVRAGARSLGGDDRGRCIDGDRVLLGSLGDLAALSRPHPQAENSHGRTHRRGGGAHGHRLTGGRRCSPDRGFDQRDHRYRRGSETDGHALTREGVVRGTGRRESSHLAGIGSASRRRDGVGHRADAGRHGRRVGDHQQVERADPGGGRRGGRGQRSGRTVESAVGERLHRGRQGR